MEFLREFGLDAGNMRDHHETTAPEPQPGFQGKGGAHRYPRCPSGLTFTPTRSYWKDHSFRGDRGVGDEAKAEPVGPTVNVKTLHAKIGELTLENDFYPVRSARQDCWAEIIDREHKLSVVRQTKLFGFSRGSS